MPDESVPTGAQQIRSIDFRNSLPSAVKDAYDHRRKGDQKAAEYGRVNQNCATRYHSVAAYISLCTAAADNLHRRHDLRDSMRPNQYQRQFET